MKLNNTVATAFRPPPLRGIPAFVRFLPFDHNKETANPDDAKDRSSNNHPYRFVSRRAGEKP